LFSSFPSPLLDLEKGCRTGIRTTNKGKEAETGLKMAGCPKGVHLGEGERDAVVLLSMIFGAAYFCLILFRSVKFSIPHFPPP